MVFLCTRGTVNRIWKGNSVKESKGLHVLILLLLFAWIWKCIDFVLWWKGSHQCSVTAFCLKKIPRKFLEKRVDFFRTSISLFFLKKRKSARNFYFEKTLFKKLPSVWPQWTFNRFFTSFRKLKTQLVQSEMWSFSLPLSNALWENGACVNK